LGTKSSDLGPGESTTSSSTHGTPVYTRTSMFFYLLLSMRFNPTISYSPRVIATQLPPIRTAPTPSASRSASARSSLRPPHLHALNDTRPHERGGAPVTPGSRPGGPRPPAGRWWRRQAGEHACEASVRRARAGVFGAVRAVHPRPNLVHHAAGARSPSSVPRHRAAPWPLGQPFNSQTGVGLGPYQHEK
jgi:hypothetical protein